MNAIHISMIAALLQLPVIAAAQDCNEVLKYAQVEGSTRERVIYSEKTAYVESADHSSNFTIDVPNYLNFGFSKKSANSVKQLAERARNEDRASFYHDLSAQASEIYQSCLNQENSTGLRYYATVDSKSSKNFQIHVNFSPPVPGTTRQFKNVFTAPVAFKLGLNNATCGPSQLTEISGKLIARQPLTLKCARLAAGPASVQMTSEDWDPMPSKDGITIPEVFPSPTLAVTSDSTEPYEFYTPEKSKAWKLLDIKNRRVEKGYGPRYHLVLKSPNRFNAEFIDYEVRPADGSPTKEWTQRHQGLSGPLPYAGYLRSGDKLVALVTGSMPDGTHFTVSADLFTADDSHQPISLEYGHVDFVAEE